MPTAIYCIVICPAMPTLASENEAYNRLNICCEGTLKPHCIQSSRVLVPAGTRKPTLRRHGIQAITRDMVYVADAVTLSSTMRTGGFELGSSALTSSTLK
jgi:hypothetical protein